MIARQLGHRLPQRVTNGLWWWKPAPSRSRRSRVSVRQPPPRHVTLALAARRYRPREKPLVAQRIFDAADATVGLVSRRHQRRCTGRERLLIQGIRITDVE